MNRKELIDELAKRFEGNREVAAHALDSVVDVITRSMASGEKVVIRGFGAFERSVRGAGEKVPEFKPGKDLSEVVSGARTVRDRVTESLAVVPAKAAEVAGQASRAAAGTLRAAAVKARELGESGPSGREEAGKPARKAPAKKAATK